MENVSGTVESIIFKNMDNSYVIFRLQSAKDKKAITVVGNMAIPLIGEMLEIQGEWVEHSRFGRQFKAIVCKRTAPDSAKGIERFLASRVIKGIGPSMAAKLISHFGAKALEIIEFAPQRLVEVEGIGKKRAEMIRQSFAENSDLREIMLFLETNGVSGAYAGKIAAHYGAGGLKVVKEDPYRLAEEVDGIGFRTADHIAAALGWENNHPARIKAGIQHALLQIAQNGHCCVPEEILVGETIKLLSADGVEVGLCLTAMLKEGSLCTEDHKGSLLIYPRHLYRAEIKVAEGLKRLKDKAKVLPGGDDVALIDMWEEAEGVKLADAQKQALMAASAHGVLVMTGGPGTGKTVTVKGVLAVLAAQKCHILLAAPTGRAAKRLTEACGRPASTIHRLLESTGGVEGTPLFMRNEENPLEADVIIIDEASMMDIMLMHYLLRAIPEGCRLILVGDVDQLPAVGPGSVLKDIIRSDMVPVVRLVEVFRQAEESMIVVNAHRINRGMLPDIRTSKDFQFIELAEAQEVAEAIVKLYQDELPGEGFDVRHDVQVLSPMHRQTCGVENLNKLLQAALNPEGGQQPLVGNHQMLRVGDKVMQIRNNYNKGVFNGDIGIIVKTDHRLAIVRYPEVDVVYEQGDIDEIVLAYAMSVHKSQGSEYPVVIMPLVAGHHIMLQRNLLYTAVTRAKQRVILLGSKPALHTALANDRTRRRYSLLAERLRGDGIG